jgi:hypothetical protein
LGASDGRLAARRRDGRVEEGQRAIGDWPCVSNIDPHERTATAGSPIGKGLDIDPGKIASEGARAPVDIGGYPTRRAEPISCELDDPASPAGDKPLPYVVQQFPALTLLSMDVPSRPGARSVPCGTGRGASVMPYPAHGLAPHQSGVPTSREAPVVSTVRDGRCVWVDPFLQLFFRKRGVRRERSLVQPGWLI